MKTGVLAVVAATIAAGVAASPAGAAPAVPDWAGLLRRDVRALHDDVAANHPGIVDRLNPDFARSNDAGLALALRRAARVRDYPGYRSAMAGYVAGFDDGHMSLSETAAAPQVAARWPGFLTGFAADGSQVVMTRADDAAVPIGARLIACDGRPADALAAAQVGAFRGRWQLAAVRQRFGGEVFLDRGNPFITRPARCIFAIRGDRRTVTLSWRPLDQAAVVPRLADTSQRIAPPFGLRTLTDGTVWMSMPSFNGSPASAAGQALPGMIADLTTRLGEATPAHTIVLDLRGNGGGSSEWSRRIAQRIWGDGAVRRAEAGSAYVEWRASPANLRSLESDLADRSTVAQPPEVLTWFAGIIGGMKTALADRRPLWRAPDENPAGPDTSEGAPPPPRGPVYVVTDGGCGSACLDAADLWLALGAVQIGRETSADTVYMDVRGTVLPSGLSRLVVPMKVYRGRPRGNNQPLRPVHAFPGDLRDTDALERWVAALPERSAVTAAR